MSEPGARSQSPTGRLGRWARTVSGLVAAGLVVLAVALVAVYLLSVAAGAPGPGALTLGGQLAGAVGAVASNRFARRRPGWSGLLAALAAPALLVLLGLLLWWR